MLKEIKILLIPARLPQLILLAYRNVSERHIFHLKLKGFEEDGNMLNIPSTVLINWYRDIDFVLLFLIFLFFFRSFGLL